MNNMQKIDFSRYQVKETDESKLQKFQDYALKVCEDFGITGRYRSVIFKHSRNNRAYLEGKVTFVREKFGDVSDKGRYLIACFRKTNPKNAK